MEIKELQAQKQELQERLLEAIKGFEDETGVLVADIIRIDRIDSSTLDGPATLIRSVRVALLL